MSMNRQKSTPCSTSTPTDDRWPRFLVVEAADDNNKPLTQRSDIFALTKAIEGMGGPYKSVKLNTELLKMRDLVQGTGGHGWRRYPERITRTRIYKSWKNEEAKRWTVDTGRFIYFDNKWPGNPQGNKGCLSHSTHKSVYTQSPTVLQLPKVWS